MCVRLTDSMKLSYSFKPYRQNQEKNFAEIKRATAHNEMNGRQTRYHGIPKDPGKTQDFHILWKSDRLSPTSSARIVLETHFT